MQARASTSFADRRDPDGAKHGAGMANGVALDAAALRHSVDSIVFRLDEMEKRVGDVSNFSSMCQLEQLISRIEFMRKEKPGSHRRNGDRARMDGACGNRNAEFMRQYGTILRKLSQHKYAGPFLDPVDVEGLKLDDYNEIIKRPMDLGTIKKRMETKDGTGYVNARDIHSDVRLVFTNAMKYNPETHDVHKMAKVMLEMFEERWQELLYRVTKEESRQREQAAAAHTYVDLQDSQKVAYAKMAREYDDELKELGLGLDKLRRMVLTKCRRISTEEKRKIAEAFSVLPAEEMCKALDVIAQLNPNFSAGGQSIDIDFDALDEPTLWSLKFHIDATLKQLAKKSVIRHQDGNTKGKRESCDALAKAAKKQKKKPF